MSGTPWFQTLALAAALFGGIPCVNAGADRPAAPVNVVLVHGFYSNGRIFDPLVGVLQKQGCRCYAPSLQPNDLRYGVHDLALKLSAKVDARFGNSVPLVFVTFSLGGLITRDYIENLGQGKRVQAFFMIATPNEGTLLADLSPVRGVRQLAPGSTFLKQLNADTRTWKTFPIYAYWTPLDLMIVPAANAKCSFGITRRILCPLHPWMARNPEVMADIATKIDALTVSPFAPAGNAR